ncbi:MAG: ABC transporter ATP-binding protein [Planctomycetes bacterium]|nr:ABC transporter ATP-binding protein [Planctomycetota bacterium]
MGEVTVHALRGLDMEIHEGELLVLLGPSGSGKSTLLNLLGGMDSPTSGTIELRQVEIGGLSERGLTAYRRKSVGFVFQFFNLIPTLTARENVQVAAQIADQPLPVDDALHMVGLLERADHFPSQMSGGEQQRVAIARAICKNPAVVLADEPTGALDYETGKLVLDVLIDVHRQSGKTVVMVTHNVAIGGIADRVVRLRSGQVQDVTENQSPIEPKDLTW